MDEHRSRVRRALPLVLGTSALVALVAASVAAAVHGPSRGQGEAIVSPGSVTAGAKGRTFRFTFLASTDGAAAGGVATFAFPGNWPAPHTKGSASGRVTVSPAGCSHASIVGVSGSVVTVHMTCKSTQSFTLTYGGVTVPGQPGLVTFKVQTADGTLGQGKHGVASLRPIATSPLLTVSGTASGQTGGTTSSAIATRLAVSAPSSVGAGTSAVLTVTAVDGGGRTVSGYTGVVHLTSSDGAAMLPADAHLKNGVGTFSVLLKTAGAQTITAADTVNQSLTGTSGSISVGPGPATHFSVTAPPSGTAGSALSFTVKAIDQFGNTATGYTGIVHFTSSDGVANLPADSTLSSGTGTFTETPTVAGTQTVTATETATSSITGTSAPISVGAGSTASSP